MASAAALFKSRAMSAADAFGTEMNNRACGASVDPLCVHLRTPFIYGVDSSLTVASLAFLAYDVCLTLPDEVAHIWRCVRFSSPLRCQLERV
jgi:hypothetical protein